MRFAPGPSDPRWGAILRERPDLAPALEVSDRVQRAKPARGRAGGDRASEAGPRDQPTGSGADDLPDNKGDETPFKPEICGVLVRTSSGMDGALSNRTKRLRALGNICVPDCAEWIGRILAVALEKGVD